MTDDTPDPDLQRIVEEMASDKDPNIYIDNPSPALQELVTIALKLERQGTLASLLRVARMMRDR